MARKKTWNTGNAEKPMVGGRYYFIHRESRMTRTWDVASRPVPEKQGWEQVSLEVYLEFRKETAAMSKKKRAALHSRLNTPKETLPCPKPTKSPKRSSNNTPGSSRSNPANTQSASPRGNARKKASK